MKKSEFDGSSYVLNGNDSMKLISDYHLFKHNDRKTKRPDSTRTLTAGSMQKLIYGSNLKAVTRGFS